MKKQEEFKDVLPFDHNYPFLQSQVNMVMSQISTQDTEELENMFLKMIKRMEKPVGNNGGKDMENIINNCLEKLQPASRAPVCYLLDLCADVFTMREDGV